MVRSFVGLGKWQYYAPLGSVTPPDTGQVYNMSLCFRGCRNPPEKIVFRKLVQAPLHHTTRPSWKGRGVVCKQASGLTIKSKAVNWFGNKSILPLIFLIQRYGWRISGGWKQDCYKCNYVALSISTITLPPVFIIMNAQPEYSACVGLKSRSLKWKDNTELLQAMAVIPLATSSALTTLCSCLLVEVGILSRLSSVEKANCPCWQLPGPWVARTHGKGN